MAAPPPAWAQANSTIARSMDYLSIFPSGLNKEHVQFVRAVRGGATASRLLDQPTVGRPEIAVGENMVQHMHAQFADLGRFEPHPIDTTGLSLAEDCAAPAQAAETPR